MNNNNLHKDPKISKIVKSIHIIYSKIWNNKLVLTSQVELKIPPNPKGVGNYKTMPMTPRLNSGKDMWHSKQIERNKPPFYNQHLKTVKTTPFWEHLDFAKKWKSFLFPEIAHAKVPKERREKARLLAWLIVKIQAIPYHTKWLQAEEHSTSTMWYCSVIQSVSWSQSQSDGRRQRMLNVIVGFSCEMKRDKKDILFLYSKVVRPIVASIVVAYSLVQATPFSEWFYGNITSCCSVEFTPAAHEETEESGRSEPQRKLL